jgi:hypothetical protein
LIGDVVHFARRVPTVPVERRMHLAGVVAAREAARPKPSWVAVFLKAYGMVAARWPELRRAYLGFPWPRLYEHPINIASIAVERQFGDETGVLFARIRHPEGHPLPELDARLRWFKERPIEQVGNFRRALLVARLPRPLRRLAWWVGLNAWGWKRARKLGTFGISVYSSLGAASLHPITPLTTTLNYGPIDADGNVDVRLIYDHRVLDGCTVARALEELERVLKCEVLAELRYLHALDAA